MRRAFELALRGLGLASPNPMVGAVVVASDGEVAGTGWHAGPGTPHAEVRALGEAGTRAAGGTLYVTLEPCTHQGRTPPCAPAIVDARVARVVASVADPNPLVAGGGFAALRAAGIEVAAGALAHEGLDLIEAFAKAVTTGMPFVTVKLAMSLDGKVAARDRSSRWVTGQEARQDAHRLRARHDAIMVGAETVLVDDPALTVRLYGFRGRQPVRIVVDGAGRVPPTGRIFDGSAPLWIATGDASTLDQRWRWEAAGARVWAAPERGPGRIALRPLLATWADPERDGPIRSVLIEGGPTLAWSAVAEGLADRFVFYVAPKLIGGVDAPSALGGPGVASIEGALGVRIESVEPLDGDLKIVASPAAAEWREG
jgi:diaminohydroxyphosphoribosylaminopyrimidine deaminase/5-amino-6-(5-phosphoribosylamino)uracil reductase